MFVASEREATVDYSANNQVTREITKGGLIRDIKLRLTMQPTATAGQNVAANVMRGGPWGVIRRLEIVLNGSEQTLSLPGWVLPYLATHWSQRAPWLDETLGDGSTVNPSLVADLTIPFLQPFAVRPMDTVLDARALRTLEIKVTWGDHTNVLSAATGFTTAPSLDVVASRATPVPAEIKDSTVFMEWRRTSIEDTIAATATQRRLNLSRGFVYRGLFLVTTDGGVIQGDILNELTIKSGATTYFRELSSTLRESTRERYGIDARNVSAVYSRGENSFAGVYWWDHVYDGRLTESIDTLRFSEFFLEMDVTVGAGATLLHIFPHQLIPARAVAA